MPTTATPPPPRPAAADAATGRQSARWVQSALFFGCVIWYGIAHALASSAASGFALRFNMSDEEPLLETIALLFLVILGISALRGRERRVMSARLAVGLPPRDTARSEWATGAAVGWGVAAASALAMLLARELDIQLWTAPRALWLLALGAASLVLATLAKAIALYGYGFRHLVEGSGPARATTVLVAIVIIEGVLSPSPAGTPGGARVLVSALGALLLCLCWLRTRAIWMGWGAWFGWAASTALIFGLPLGNEVSYSGVVDGRTFGPVWLTGGIYGPSASAFLVILLLLAIPVIIRLTDDYAWSYARRPIVPAGIPVDVPAPAAHAAMEPPPSPAPSLVQIQPVAAASPAPHVTSDTSRD
jgi:hypothetical protein